MQRWEYRVISLRDGTYTASLNEYGRDGWELVSVAPNPVAPAPPESGGLPRPRTLGRLEDAAAQLNRLGNAPETEAQPTSNLLWVLRRPLPPDDADDRFET
jgi:hypothetical protein